MSLCVILPNINNSSIHNNIVLSIFNGDYRCGGIDRESRMVSDRADAINVV